jgi:hypothetical protein
MILTMLVVAVAACSSDGDDVADDASTDGPPVPSVTVPPERLTPFCAAMIELADRLETDPPDDARTLILDTYLGIVDDVPPAIESEFRAVIAELQGEAPPTTSTTTTSTTSTTTTVATDAAPASAVSSSLPEPGVEDFDAEGRLPGDSPSERVSDFVLFTCRGSDNNPGPPATEPVDDVVVDDTTG